MVTRKFTVPFLIGLFLILSVLSTDSGQRFYKAVQAAEAESEALAESLESLAALMATEATTEAPTEPSTEASTEEPTEPETEPEPWSAINPDGMTVLTRFNTPEGYTRVKAEKNSFAEFVLNYPLKEDGAQILLYNGKPGQYQSSHMAVFQLPIENVDLQQCADSVMRFYAEYYWSMGRADELKFYYTTGFVSEYSKWRDGYGIQYVNKQFSWYPRAGYDDSYGTFVKFLRHAFTYAGSRSMDYYESSPISIEDIQIGDVFLEGGSPGHVIMVVDVCYDADGNIAFLLGDGHTPAQDFHVMKNPKHEDDPWYYAEEITYPFWTYAHIYSEGALQRLTYAKSFGISERLER